MLSPYIQYYYIIISYILAVAAEPPNKHGLLLLYRPLDVSNECAFSGNLRYDLSYGMGLSDTMTMVFRTINGLNYECNIEVVAQSPDVTLIVVIKFPTSLLRDCIANQDAITVLKENECIRLCRLVEKPNNSSSYFVITVKDRLRFKFSSNGSINSDMSGQIYQVTATAARNKPLEKNCFLKNETLCVIKEKEFCFTNGVVCDGIKNCGVRDWFDERQSECSLPVEYLGKAPVIAVVLALAFSLLAAGHIILRCLPPLASSFFIFNANEDNRLRIDPLLHPPTNVQTTIKKAKKTSLIPIDSSTSSGSDADEILSAIRRNTVVTNNTRKGPGWKNVPDFNRGSLLRTMTAKIHNKFLAYSGRKKVEDVSALDIKIDDV